MIKKKVNAYSQEMFLAVTSCERQAGTKLHLPWRGCVYFVVPPPPSPSRFRQILVLVPRFDREFIMMFQRHGKKWRPI